MSNQEEQQYNFEYIIRVFKRIRAEFDTSDSFSVSEEEKLLIKNLDFLIQNYEQMKKSMPPGMMENMNTPLSGMVSDMVRNMSSQMGIDIDAEIRKEEEEKNILEQKQIELSQNDKLSDIGSIDKKLEEGELSEAEIDRLLDKRLDLLNNQKAELN